LQRLEESGVRGWTLLPAGGFGEHGNRTGDTDETANVVVEALADIAVAERALKLLYDDLMHHNPIIAYLTEARVLRREKFI
jgi:hypothetical protein